MQWQVTTLQNESAGTIELSDAVFGLEPRKDVLHRMVVYQLAKRRQGTHSTKSIQDVAGSTAKIYKQKGTGQARHGSKRAVGMRGGATMFGPHPRDHSLDMPKKVRKLAMRSALSAKRAEGKLRVLDAAQLGEGKTRLLVKHLAALGWQSALIVAGPTVDSNFARAARNIPALDVLPAQGANVYDILRRDILVLTRDAVTALEARLA